MSFHDIYEPGDPVLVLLHGTGGDEHDLIPLSRQLSKRMGRLGLRGREPERGVNRWFRRISEGVFDEMNLKVRAGELGGYLRERLPEQRRIAVGFSNGANMASAVILLNPEVFDGAILIAPMVPIQPTTLPDLQGRPILMICGRYDPMVSMTNAQTLATMYETAGANLTLHWHDGAHGIGQAEVNVAAAWLAQSFPS